MSNNEIKHELVDLSLYEQDPVFLVDARDRILEKNFPDYKDKESEATLKRIRTQSPHYIEPDFSVECKKAVGLLSTCKSLTELKAASDTLGLTYLDAKEMKEIVASCIEFKIREQEFLGENKPGKFVN